jgi:hypothetical protein
MKVGCTLHVRGINGDFETEEGLRQAFSAYGKFSSALVRHRTDEVGNNTSWALVTWATKHQRTERWRPR